MTDQTPILLTGELGQRVRVIKLWPNADRRLTLGLEGRIVAVTEDRRPRYTVTFADLPPFYFHGYELAAGP